MTFLTYSQILKVRRDNYAPMIIVGYPFDRSTALIAAEVSHIASCFVIDFTGEFSDYFHGDAVILKPNELSCYFDMDSSNRYYINLSFLEPEDRYVNLVYILSYHIDLGTFFTVATQEQERHSSGKLRFTLFLRDLDVGCIELPVAVGL